MKYCSARGKDLRSCTLIVQTLKSCISATLNKASSTRWDDELVGCINTTGTGYFACTNKVNAPVGWKPCWGLFNAFENLVVGNNAANIFSVRKVLLSLRKTFFFAWIFWNGKRGLFAAQTFNRKWITPTEFAHLNGFLDTGSWSGRHTLPVKGISGIEANFALRADT